MSQTNGMGGGGGNYNVYESPLVARNASPEMVALFSPQRKHSTWRRIWLALAEAEKSLGLPITDQQLAEMKAHLDDIDFDYAAKEEARVRHDVMAHLHTFAKAAPSAKPILHLGATSMDIVDNTDVLLARDAMALVAQKMANLIDALGHFALRYRDLPCLAYTHLQPAQPTTVGKRAVLWAYDFVLCLADIELKLQTLMLRGIKGTTGTQASFLELFEGDHEKVRKLEFAVAERLGFARVHPVSGQTYSRIVDAQMIGSLGALAAAAHKLAIDVRVLSSFKEIDEPFEEEQVGSSAMAYKRNPTLTERVTGLSRFLMNLVGNPLQTAAEQIFERTLDDSSNKRITIPEAFLTADAILDILIHVSRGLVVNQAVIRQRLEAELPFMATENILMAAVKAGGDRQDLHERIRRHSQEAAKRVKQEGKSNDLLARLQTDSAFASTDVTKALDPMLYVGRSSQQVDEFTKTILDPIRQRYSGKLQRKVQLKV
ncbi:MAG: adenylosuccinate lyase [Phycisphaerales bacterium]|nr:adenylosuccinate lyase [Phycisphaerales bacterium]